MSNLSSQLYATLTHPDTMRQLLANFFTDSKAQAIALLQKSGVAISNNATVKQVQLAWLKAIKDSAAFRQQAAVTLTGYVTAVKNRVHGSTHNFVKNIDPYFNDAGSDDALANAGITAEAYTPTTSTTPVATSQYNLSDFGITALNGTTAGDVAAASGASAAVAGAAAAPASSSSGGFFSTLGNIFTGKVIGQGISTGLQAFSTNMTAQANQTSEKNALAIEQAKLAQAQLAAQTPSGLSAGWIIGLSVLGVGLLIAVVAIATRKKK